jgi:uncharacterized protein YutE (UPF0331/DUF86 family)
VVDKALLLRKLAALESYLKQIGEYAGISAAQYRADWKLQRIIDRTLQLMIETCADVANHLISDGELSVPTSYANTFEVLDQAGVINSELARGLVQMAKFRNILVHQYTEVDAEIVT